MATYGIVIGIGLVAVVCVCAWLLAAKAHAHVRRFREEQHTSFVGRRRP